MKLAVTIGPRDFDPHRSLDYTVTGLGMVMDRALTMDKDFNIAPALVKTWEIVGQGEQYTFKLQPNAKWQNRPPANGRKVDAEDIAYNLMRIAGKTPGDKPSERPRIGTLPGMDRAEAVDPQTVRVVMATPNASFLNGITDARNRMIPREMPSQLAFDDPSKATGSGPFTVEKYDDRVGASYARFADYWNTDTQGQHLPYLDRVQIDWLSDDSSTMAAFLAGKIDYRLVNTPDERDTVKKSRAVAQILKHPVGNRDQWRFNTRKKPFDDPRVWKALHLALNYADISDAYYGKGNWDYTAILPSSFPGALRSDEVSKLPGYNPDTKQKDIEDAKQLLSAAGYSDGKLSFSIWTYPGGDTYKTNAINIQAQMKKIWPNMDIKIDIAPDTATFNRTQSDGSFDSTSYAIVPVLDSVLEFQIQYGTKGSRNYGAYSNPALDDLLAKALIEYDANKRNQLVREAQQVVLDGGNPTLWLQSQYYFHAFDPKVRGIADVLSASIAGSAGSGLPIALADIIWFAKT